MLCSIVGCSNNDKVHTGFYRFPKDEVLCDLWIDLSQRRDGLNVQNARVCSKHFTADDFRLGGSKKYINKEAVPTLFLPAAVQNHPFIIAARKQVIAVDNPESMELEAQKSVLLDHDYIFDIKMPNLAKNSSVKPAKNQSGPEFIVEQANDCVVDLKRICRFCLNACDDADTVRIAWDVWELSKLSQLYEEITKLKLIISVKCSELCCNNCSRLLRDTYKSIQMFREAHEFWQLHLDMKLHVMDEIVETHPIEEVKIEVHDDVDFDEYVENFGEDVIFVEEPMTMVDKEATNLDIVKLEQNDDSCKDDEDDNEYYESSRLNFEGNFSPKPNISKTVKRSVFDCDVEFLDDTTSFCTFTGNRSVADEGIPIFDCDLCDKVYTTQRGLNAHKQAKHGFFREGFRTYDCDICGKILKSQTNLKLHKLIHKRSLNTLASCDECGKAFRDQHLLRVHKRQIHGPHQPSMCNECGKVLRNRSRLLVHMLTHTPVKPTCEHCQKIFSSKKTIIEHMKVVHKQGKVHICEQCGKQFRNTSAGRKHSKNCTNTKNRRSYAASGKRAKCVANSATACRFCSKSYTTLVALQDHYNRRHNSSELELLCMQCNVLMESNEALAAHNQIAHEKLRCTVCKKNCPTETSLAIHMEKHVNGKQRFDCEICGGSYARSEYLKTHHRRRHTSERPFQCTALNCNSSFADKSDLHLHQRSRHAPVTDRPHACDVCGKRFTIASILRRHMTQHTGIGAVKCVECNETFRYKSYLDTHILAAHRNTNVVSQS